MWEGAVCARDTESPLGYWSIWVMESHVYSLLISRTLQTLGLSGLEGTDP